MFRILPIIRRSANLNQNRKLWGLSRYQDPRHIIRDMERRMRDFERDFFDNKQGFFRLTDPSRFVPIQGVPPHKFHVDVDVSGYKPDDIKISMKDKMLRIEAKLDETGKDGSRWQQSLVKEVTVPDNLDLSTVESFLHQDGILRIEGSLTKEAIEDEGVKKIPIDKAEEKQSLKSKM